MTLAIDPGVEVQFEYGTSFTVAGRLLALGEIFSNIEFEPFSNNPSPRDWTGIKFLDSSFGCILNWTRIKFADAAINCTASTSPRITNCTIDTSHFYAVYCGEYSTPVIRDCTIRTVLWTGIICDNKSYPQISHNIIETCLHGIVCYSPAEVRNNTIHKCWVAILCWGDATIDNNTISNFCTDGIQAFHSDPIIKHNNIDGCMGNGTRFTFSNATVLYNNFRSNKVGMDITYEAKGVLDNMKGNYVNEIDVKDLYYVGVYDEVIERLYLRSGWGLYTGYLTAQGSVTLYDCKNVTFKDCNIENSMNSIYAANSTLQLYNTTLENAEQSELYLMLNSQAKSYNDSVEVNAVRIADSNCLFMSYDDLHVTVLDHDLIPIEGATVVVKEDLIELHNTTTDFEGKTPNLVVKDRAVSSSGVIPSPLTIEVFADGYNFEDNPREGVYAADTDNVAFVDMGDIWPPTVASANIEHGEKTVEVDTGITISFSEAMNQTATEKALSISGSLGGIISWSGFNMTFTPSQGFEYQTYYTVTIDEDATDLAGNHLEAPYVFSFTTIPEPKTASIGLIAVAVVAVVALMGVGSWYILKRMK